MSQFLELPDSTATEMNMTEYIMPVTDPESLSLISEWEVYQEGYNTDMSGASKGKQNEAIVESKSNHSMEGLSVSEMTEEVSPRSASCKATVGDTTFRLPQRS